MHTPERRRKNIPVGYDRRSRFHDYGGPKPTNDDDDSGSIFSTVAAVETAVSLFDTPSFDSPSIPDSTPDFGGFDGGSSGGGGADSSW